MFRTLRNLLLLNQICNFRIVYVLTSQDKRSNCRGIFIEARIAEKHFPRRVKDYGVVNVKAHGTTEIFNFSALDVEKERMRDKSAGQGEATKSRVRNSAHVRIRVRVNTPRVVSAFLGIFCTRLPPLNSPIPPSLLFSHRILANDILSPIDSVG